MGFRLAPREVAHFLLSRLVPRFRPFWVRFSRFGGRVEGLKMMVNEFAFAISTVHFRTLRKWIKAISEVQAD